MSAATGTDPLPPLRCRSCVSVCALLIAGTADAVRVPGAGDPDAAWAALPGWLAPAAVAFAVAVAVGVARGIDVRDGFTGPALGLLVAVTRVGFGVGAGAFTDDAHSVLG